MRGNGDVIKVMLADSRFDPTHYTSKWALQVAAKHGFLNVVKSLLKKGVDPSVPVEGLGLAVISASKNGHHKIVKLLLEDPRVDPTVQRNAAVYLASENGHDKVVELLLAWRPSKSDVYGEKLGIDFINNYNGMALKAASEKGHEKVVKLLLDNLLPLDLLKEQTIKALPGILIAAIRSANYRQTKDVLLSHYVTQALSSLRGDRELRNLVHRSNAIRNTTEKYPRIASS